MSKRKADGIQRCSGTVSGCISSGLSPSGKRSTLRRKNQNLCCFSIFVLFLLSETTNTFKRAIQEETDLYNRRNNQVQDVCSQHGLTHESDRKSLHEDEIDFREIHLKYTSKVPDKVTQIKFQFLIFSIYFSVLHNASQEVLSCVLLDP